MSRGFEQHNFIRYLILMGCGFVCALAVMVGINTLVDPAHILASDSQEKRMASLTHQGQHLSGVSNFNDRLFQMFRINLLDTAPDRFVIGSSRAMQIRDGLLPGVTANNAVMGASLEDYFAIVQLYNERGMLPKNVLFVVDPWVFNAANKQSRWVSLRDKCRDLAEALNVTGLCPSGTGGLSSQTWRDLLSFGYLRESLRRLMQDGRGAIGSLGGQAHGNFKAMNTFPLKDGGRLADGSLIYPLHSRIAPVEEINKQAVQYAKLDPVYSLGGFRQLDPVYRHGFEALLGFFKDQGRDVTILLAPYHPTTTRLLRENEDYGPRLEEVEVFVREVSDVYGAKLHGGYFASMCSVGEFIDAMHARDSCMAKILQVPLPQIYAVIR